MKINFKALAFLLALGLMHFASSELYAQKLSVNDGEISFFSKTPARDIEAVNKKVSSILDPKTKEVVVLVKIKQFKFTNNLMEDHFNENYLESDKYPNSTFKGKIQEDVDFAKPGKYPVTANGQLTMHGVTKDATLKGTLDITDKETVLNCSFPIMLVDYNIERPKLVMVEIAEKIDCKGKFSYKPVSK